MRPELLEEAMGHISDKHIRESATIKKHPGIGWLHGIAAILALALLLQWLPLSLDGGNTASAPEAEAPLGVPETLEPGTSLDKAEEFSVSGLYAVATAAAPRVYGLPAQGEFEDNTAYDEAVAIWLNQRNQQMQKLESALAGAQPFLTESTAVFLDSSNGENRVYSPINSYIALAMLAEVTGGSSRQQILDAMGISDLETLRSQVSTLWECTYYKDENCSSFLANSFWLDEGISYRQQTLDDLAYYHYASSYQGDLGSAEMNQVLRQWLREQTGGLLENQIGNLEIAPQSVLALASTAILKAAWTNEFSEANNTTDLFHTPSGDQSCTFMNKKEWDHPYYRGENYGAVHLSLDTGGGMWLFLPDEGTDVSQLLAQGGYWGTMANAASNDNPQRQNVLLNLSVPKFDVHSSADLAAGLQELGITHIFDPAQADFSASITTDLPVFVSSVNQAARVRIDEKGAAAASYVVIVAPGASMPPEDPKIVDFILDRPFLFVLEQQNVPVFAGVVNEP